MTRQQLLALQAIVHLGEVQIETMPRTRNHLGWARELRLARQALRELTRTWIDTHCIREEDFCATRRPERFVGRTIRTVAGLGTVVQKPAGVFVEVKLACSHAGCDQTFLAHLACGAPGLCYVTDPNSGAYLADLRNDMFVCREHAGARRQETSP